MRTYPAGTYPAGTYPAVSAVVGGGDPLFRDLDLQVLGVYARHMNDRGLGLFLFWMMPGLLGWLSGLVVTLTMLLLRPRLGGGSWLMMLIAQVVWFKSFWLLGERLLGNLPVNIMLSFSYSFAMHALPALALRRLDRRQRPYLYDRA